MNHIQTKEKWKSAAILIKKKLIIWGNLQVKKKVFSGFQHFETGFDDFFPTYDLINLIVFIKRCNT